MLTVVILGERTVAVKEPVGQEQVGPQLPMQELVGLSCCRFPMFEIVHKRLFFGVKN